MTTQCLNNNAIQSSLSIPSAIDIFSRHGASVENIEPLDRISERKGQQVAKYRALFTLSRYWPAIGGSELHTRYLIHALNRYAEVSVVCHNSDSKMTNELATATSVSKFRNDRSVEVHQIGPVAFRRTLLTILANLHKNLRISRPAYDRVLKPVSHRAIYNASNGCDLIHNVYNGLTSFSEVSLEVARTRGLPFVFTPLTHTHAPEGTAWSSKRIMTLYKQADALIAMTSYERDWLIKHGANPNTIYVCPVGPLVSNDIDEQTFRRTHDLNDAPVVLFLGRHVETKGYKELAKAAARVWEVHPRTHLLFVGPQTSTSRIFFQQFKDSRITILDHVSDTEKSAALAACDLLCVPSTQESLGVIYLEAWNYKKPVIAADIEVMHSIIRPNIDGILVRPESERIANAINGLLSNPKQARNMGEAGQEKLRTNFSWDAIALAMSSIHRNVLSK